uniref:Uncharacterized protein n=1 Tax=Sparus aurata TaxID=8175 RepID=A0A671U7F0_SPAAU
MEQRTCLLLSESLSCTLMIFYSHFKRTTFFKVNHTSYSDFSGFGINRENIYIIIRHVTKVIRHISIYSFICVCSTNSNHYGIWRRVFRQTGFINGLAEHWGVIISIQHSDVYDYST